MGGSVKAGQTEHLAVRDVGQTFKHDGVGVGVHDAINAVIKIEAALPAFTRHQKRQNLLAQRLAPAIAEQGIPGKRGTGGGDRDLLRDLFAQGARLNRLPVGQIGNVIRRRFGVIGADRWFWAAQTVAPLLDLHNPPCNFSALCVKTQFESG